MRDEPVVLKDDKHLHFKCTSYDKGTLEPLVFIHYFRWRISVINCWNRRKLPNVHLLTFRYAHVTQMDSIHAVCDGKSVWNGLNGGSSGLSHSRLVCLICKTQWRWPPASQQGTIQFDFDQSSSTFSGMCIARPCVKSGINNAFQVLTLATGKSQIGRTKYF